jgi:hypothetical protein
MQPTEMFVRGSGSRGKNLKKEMVSREHIAGNRNIRERNAHQVQAMLHGMIHS